jgi:hypothetical protein
MSGDPNDWRGSPQARGMPPGDAAPPVDDDDADAEANRGNEPQSVPNAPATPSVAEVASIRDKLWDGGFRPVALCSWDNQHFLEAERGKRPLPGKDWHERALRDPPGAVQPKPDPNALSTGILCDGLRAFDIDIDDPDLAGHCRAVILDRLGDGPRRYRDNSGRCLVLLRAAEGAPGKVTLSGTRGKIEVLGKASSSRRTGCTIPGRNCSGSPTRLGPSPAIACPR